MVVMNPRDFLQNGIGLLFYEGDVKSGRVYVAAPDGVLRAGRQNTDPRLPAFAGPKARAPADRLNPFLVVINAEMAFRRFRKHPHSLCDGYTELIDLTMSLIKKIYFEPLVAEIELELVQMGNLDNHTTARKDSAKFSRTRRVVGKPGPGASHDEIIQYRQYLMSGRGMELSIFIVPIVILRSCIRS